MSQDEGMKDNDEAPVGPARRVLYAVGSVLDWFIAGFMQVRRDQLAAEMYMLRQQRTRTAVEKARLDAEERRRRNYS
jgi:hypothetical protein